MEKTLAIIKPDAIDRNLSGRIITEIEQAGFTIIDMKLVYMSKKHADWFYEEHSGKRFFYRLSNFMSSGPCIFMVLEKDNAIEDWRKLMGPTNYDREARFLPHTIRGAFGRYKRPTHETVVHGSDSPESAVRELTFFYDELFYWKGEPEEKK